MPARPKPIDTSVPQTHYYDVKFADMDARMGGIEATQAVMASSLADTKTSIAEVKAGIQQIFNRMDSSRVEIDARPSTIRTATLLQILALVVGSSTLVSAFMFFWIAPVKEDLEESKVTTLETARRLREDTTNQYESLVAATASADLGIVQKVDRNTDITDKLLAQQLQDAERRGEVRMELAWTMDDLQAQKEDLRLHEASQAHPTSREKELAGKIEALQVELQRIDTNGSTGMLKMLSERGVALPLND